MKKHFFFLRTNLFPVYLKIFTYINRQRDQIQNFVFTIDSKNKPYEKGVIL